MGSKPLYNGGGQGCRIISVKTSMKCKTADEILQKIEPITKQHGPWTAHSIDLGCGINTLPQQRGRMWQVDYFRSIINDFGMRNFEELRILDLACLEGLYAIEYARLGAHTVGIEGRYSNLIKAIFAKEVLGLDNCEFYQDDVRNLNASKYGLFDVVLCCGILYHLDWPDVITFLEKISDVCLELCIVDTHIAPTHIGDNRHMLSDIKEVTYHNNGYIGRYFQEHSSGESDDIKLSKQWASIDNDKSFWLDRTSLYNALHDSGFHNIYEGFFGPGNIDTIDRVNFVASKRSVF